MSDKKAIDQRIETLSVVMMAVVMVAVAWSAYQATLWTGIQTFTMRDASVAGQKFLLKTLQQGQYTGLDIFTFSQYVNALRNNDQELSKFYFERFRPEFKVAVQAWLETKPLENPNAPSSPFAMPEYNMSLAKEAEEFTKQAELKLQEAQQANQNADSYVFMTVIYSGVQFINGIMSRTSGRLRLILLVVSLVVFSVTTVMLFRMPVTLS